MDISDLLKEKRTLIMGILNVTPDSFSDGGKYTRVDLAIRRAQEMIKEGADIIDIGGESTRPGADSVSIEEEIDRVVPVITAIHKESPQIIISVDTNKSKVAEAALKAGAHIVNSLGGFTFDPQLAKIVAYHQCSIIIYHIQGVPRTMQHEPHYGNIIQEMKDFFASQMEIGQTAGIAKDMFILDPGIGFGKTVEHNIEIIKHIDEFVKMGKPVLIGVSRKSHLGMLLQKELSLPSLQGPHDRLEAALAETAVAVLKGARIVRTHDVLETKKFISILDVLHED